MVPWWRDDGVDVDKLVVVAVTGAALAAVSDVRNEMLDGHAELLAREVVWPAWSSWTFALPRSFRARRVSGALGPPDRSGTCRCSDAGRVSPGELIATGRGGDHWAVVRDVAGSPSVARVWPIDEEPFRAFLPVAEPDYEVPTGDAAAVLWAALETAAGRRRFPRALSAKGVRHRFVDGVIECTRTAGWRVSRLPDEYSDDVRRST